MDRGAAAMLKAQSGLGPIWAHKALWAHQGPYGPIRARFGKKLIMLMKNHKIINKSIKVVKLEFLKVKTWFGDKDLFS